MAKYQKSEPGQPARVTLTTMVSPAVAESIRQKAAAKNQTVSAFLSARLERSEK